jgi:hypothetical protein
MRTTAILQARPHAGREQQCDRLTHGCGAASAAPPRPGEGPAFGGAPSARSAASTDGRCGAARKLGAGIKKYREQLAKEAAARK